MLAGTLGAIALLFLSSLQPQAAHSATPCATVDLSPTFPPPKHQGDSLYCYAFTVADALSYELGIVPPNSLSAFDVLSHFVALHDHELDDANQSMESNYPLAITLRSVAGIKNNMPVSRRWGGQNGLAAAAIINRGYACLEKDVPSQIIENGFPATHATRTFLDDRIKAIAADPRDNPAAYACLETTAPPWAPLAEIPAFVSNWAAQKLRKDTAQTCRTKIPIKGIAVNNFIYANQPAESSAKLNEILASKRPAMIAYDLCLIQACPNGVPQPHASLIVGQAVNPATGTCEVKIRNNYGTECATVAAASGARCEKGYWFIDREKFARTDHMIEEIVKL